MTTMTETERDDPGLPRLHQGDPGGDLGRDHQARVDRRYGYGGSVEYDLRPGGAYRAHASEEILAAGAPEVVVDGEVIEADPPRKLVQTWRMLMDPDMAAEGFTRLTYEIEPADGGVTGSPSPTTSTARQAGGAVAGELEARAPAAAGTGCSATSRRCWRPASRWSGAEPAGEAREEARAGGPSPWATGRGRRRSTRRWSRSRCGASARGASRSRARSRRRVGAARPVPCGVLDEHPALVRRERERALARRRAAA